MKVINLIILSAFIVSACSTNKKIPDEIERIFIDVDNVTQDASSLIEKIEIVPLETNDSSLLYRIEKIIYDKKMDIYAIYTGDQIVYTFWGDGKYISNSRGVKGQGPKEYIMALDINFNPYLEGIDMLNPYGTIYTYSPTFELLAKRKFEPEFPINNLIALDSDNYIFTYPFIWTDQEVSFVNLKTQYVVNTNYEGTISGGIYIGNNCFYHINDEFYFVPLGLNYYFYRIDTKEKKLIPIIYLDFGDFEVKSDGLPGRAWGKRSDSKEKRKEISAEVKERFKFLSKSNNVFPMSKFFNDDYAYVYFKKAIKGTGNHFIYNRKTNDSFLFKDKKPFSMYPCLGIVDNVLFSMCKPDMISQIVDRKFMSLEEINKMESLKEDDNNVIAKYYLKK